LALLLLRGFFINAILLHRYNLRKWQVVIVGAAVEAVNNDRHCLSIGDDSLIDRRILR